MAISFIRVDNRLIHGQTCTRWIPEYPCDGLIAVDDAAANNAVLKSAFKSASGKKTFVWGVKEFLEKSGKVLESKDDYFLITKNPMDMETILLSEGFRPGIQTVFVGVCDERPGAIKLGNNQAVTQEEAQAFENIMNAGYEVEFALIREEAIGNWRDFRGQFGFE